MKKTTMQLLEILKKSEDINRHISENEESFSDAKPHDLLNDEIKRRSLSKSEVIKKSLIETHYAYQILSGMKTPSRDKLLMLCFALEMDLEETQKTLLRCSYPQLYAKNKRDNVIMFALNHNITVIETNELLFEIGLDIFE